MSAGRDAILAGLREVADYLEAHPDLPVPRYGLVISVHAGTDTDAAGDAAGRAEVEATAAVMGAIPTTTPGGHYVVTRGFTGGWQYTVLRIPDEAMRHHRAKGSYAGNVQVGGDAG